MRRSKEEPTTNRTKQFLIPEVPDSMVEVLTATIDIDSEDGDVTGEKRFEYRTAIFSPCMTYRYILDIYWGKILEPRNSIQFIGLNPSTATHFKNDPTVRRCIDYVKRWGYNGMTMTNLFAYRATDPVDMQRVSNPFGEVSNHWNINDLSIGGVASKSTYTVAAWGTKGWHMNGADRVIGYLRRPIMCLKKTKGGCPSHPLYLKKNLEMEYFIRDEVEGAVIDPEWALEMVRPELPIMPNIIEHFTVVDDPAFDPLNPF